MFFPRGCAIIYIVYYSVHLRLRVNALHHIDERKISRRRSAEKLIIRGVFEKTGSHGYGREYGYGTIDSNC